MTFSKYVGYIIEKANELCAQNDREDRRAEYLYAVMLMQMTEPYYPQEWWSDQPYEKERLMCLLEEAVCVTGYKKHTEQLCNKINISCSGRFELYDDVIAVAFDVIHSKEKTVLTADYLFVALVSKLEAGFLNAIVPKGVDVLLKKFDSLDFYQNEDAANYPSRRAMLNKILTPSSQQFKNFEDLKEHILSSIHMVRYTDHTDVMLPILLPGTDRCLVLSAGMTDGERMISDNGAAANALMALTNDYETCKKRLENLSVQMLGFVPSENGELRCVVKNRKDFIKFLQTVFIATYLDVFNVAEPTKEVLKSANSNSFKGWSGRSSGFEHIVNNILNLQDAGFLGTAIEMNFYFSNESSSMQLLLKGDESEGAHVSYTDDYGGLMYERVLFMNEDNIEDAQRMMKILCDVFSCQQMGADIKMYYDCTDIYSTPAAMFKYLYFASVLGEYGGLLS